MIEQVKGQSIYTLPVADLVLIYAPLHGLATLVNRQAASDLRGLLQDDANGHHDKLNAIARRLLDGGDTPPEPRSGPLEPGFLGLLPTRACNLDCRYCGFANPESGSAVMELSLARDAIDWYIDTTHAQDRPHLEIHFFGGEPFCGPEVLDFTVNHAHLRAAETGRSVQFEAATNGIFSADRARWAADNLDTIVLSLDGPPEIQNKHRPYRGGQPSFETVDRTARILSEGQCRFYIRACIIAETVTRMPDLARWFCETYHPAGVCFEPLQEPIPPSAVDFDVPDPWLFARNFLRAEIVLDQYGVEATHASADIRVRRVSFCPVGQDSLIVTPDGKVSNCYLLPREWEARNLDLRLGEVNGKGKIHIDPEALESTRQLNVWNKPFCESCFCRWHCAGGCHVNHQLPEKSGDFDARCIETRSITLARVLQALGRHDLILRLIDEPGVLEAAVLQTGDTLLVMEGPLLFREGR